MAMTTLADRGTEQEPERLPCPLRAGKHQSTLTLALRDMRQAHGRDVVNGSGFGNESWVALVLAMIVLDTLTGEEQQDQGRRWRELLVGHDVPRPDAEIAYALRCSLLHGYGLPRKDARHANGRTALLTPPPSAPTPSTPSHRASPGSACPSSVRGWSNVSCSKPQARGMSRW